MLVLSRKPGEKILIGDNGAIKVTVVEVKGNKVRLGIEASPDIVIYREEIFEAVKARVAAATPADDAVA